MRQGAVELGEDTIIRRNLRQGSGTAGPRVVEIKVATGKVVVRIVENMSIWLKSFCPEHCVVENALHAVAVASIAGHTQ